MADIVNLRQRRKQAARQQAKQEAAENRVRFGRTKPQRLKDQTEIAKERDALAGKKIERMKSRSDE